MRKFNYSYALLLAPLLMGSGGGGAITSPLTVPSLPSCTAGQFFVYRSGAVVCEAVGGGSLSVGNCMSSSQLLTITRMGQGTDVVSSNFGCVAKPSITGSTVDMTALNSLVSEVSALNSLVNGLTTTFGRAYWRANSTETTHPNGILKNAKDNGLIGAKQYCVDTTTAGGANTHMCDAEEVYESAVGTQTDKLATGRNATKGWIYTPWWIQRLGTTNMANKGLGDNCASFHYSTAHFDWQGTVLVTGTSYTLANNTAATDFGWKVRYAPEGCNNTNPVACCAP